MRHQRLSLEDLELVHAIGTAGSLTGGAKVLGMDHSSAFRRLATMEARAGTVLFRRSRRGYVATEAGELVVVAAQRMLAEADFLTRQLDGRDDKAEGRIRITLPDTLAAHVARLCADFATAHPSVRCDLVVANAFFALQKQDADVAIRAAMTAPDGLSTKRLATIATAVYGPSTEDDNAPVPGGRWIGFDETLSHLASARWIREHVAPGDIVMHVNSLPAALAACQAGVGRALLPCYFADGAARVVRIGEPLPDVQTHLWFATHPDLRRSAKIRLFREFAVQWMKQHLG